MPGPAVGLAATIKLHIETECTLNGRIFMSHFYQLTDLSAPGCVTLDKPLGVSVSVFLHETGIMSSVHLHLHPYPMPILLLM